MSRWLESKRLARWALASPLAALATIQIFALSSPASADPAEACRVCRRQFVDCFFRTNGNDPGAKKAWQKCADEAKDCAQRCRSAHPPR